MPPYVTPAIPASQIVAVTPSVLPAGGNALDLIGLLLTQNQRIPTGQIYQFPTSASAASFFGAMTQEAALAAIYFLGYDNSSVKPGSMLVTQYNTSPVPAWLRGGNLASVGLAGVQAVVGQTLSITIDGAVHTGSVTLSGATSYSAAAQLIAEALDIPALPVAATFTGSISTTTLTVSTLLSGSLSAGDVLSGGSGGNIVTAGTYVVDQIDGTPGGVGTYTVSASQTVTATSITAVQPAAVFTASISTTTMTVSSAVTNTLAAGQIISGAGVTAGTYIVSQNSGGTPGGAGTYVVSASQTVSPGVQMTADAPGVTYDSVSGGFVVTSASYGATSTIGFFTGTAAATLLLTQATGAVTSQGADALTPGTGEPVAFMDNVLTITQNWASFMTAWEPTDADKVSFALWNNNQDNRFLYAMWTTNNLNIGNIGPSPEVATITEGNYSGTAMIWDDPSIDPMGGQIAAFTMGYGASLDFNQTNGRTTFAFRTQSGLSVQVTSAAVALNLLGYGLDFYGDYTTANQAFLWLNPGSVSGPFAWLDSYMNQIWFNSQLQVALMVLMQNAKSMPYNAVGTALIEAGILDPITAAVNFGAIQAGVPLSAAQAAEVNQQAGVVIDTVLTARGWYVQVLPASPQVRQARGSPPINIWYMDGESIQKLALNSVLIQ
jgi:Protein of unknown function (DUF3383)